MHGRCIVGRVLHHSGKGCKKKNPAGIFIMIQAFTCFSNTCKNSTGGLLQLLLHLNVTLFSLMLGNLCDPNWL